MLHHLAPLRHSKARFLFAILTVFIALTLTAAAQWIFGSTPVLLFALAVILSTGFFGLPSGLCTAAAAAFTLDFFYIPPSLQLNLDADTLRVGAELVTLAACTSLIEHRVAARLRDRVKLPLGIRGSFDGALQDGDIYGWAFDADHPELPVMVTVFGDKRPIATAASVCYRPDVATAMNCSGRHGFYIKLEQYLPGDTEAMIDVRLANGTPLESSPRLVRTLPRARSERPTVLFMHIPKTAGTAFRESIAANFRESEIAYLYPGPPGFLVSDLRALPLEQRRAYRMVIGHFQFGMHEALPQISEYITVVREPGARILSQYAFLRETQPELVADSAGRLMSLEQVFEKRLTTDFDNTLVRCFSGVDERDFPPGTINREIYREAVHNIETAFTFVGHQECSAAAYAWLKGYYGWNATEGLPAVNIGQKKQLSGKEITSLDSVIRNYNSWDYLLYDEILLRFPPSAVPPRAG